LVIAWHGCSSFHVSVPKTPHYHLQHLLDWTRVACQVTRPHTILLLPKGLHEHFWLTHHSQLWRGFYCLFRWGSIKPQAET
jgi:hypothetical protein